MKNFKRFIEENANQERVREKIKREKEADKLKHDRMMDQARRRDTTVANAKEETKKGLWYNIHQKRKRGEKPNPPGHPDRPSAQDFKDAAKTSKK